MSLSFNEFNTLYEQIRQTVKAEIEEEMKLDENFGAFFGKKPEQSHLSREIRTNKASYDAKLAAEFRRFKNDHDGNKLTFDEYKKIRNKIRNKEWEHAKQTASNINRITDVEAAR